jgi:hypothetical protein
MVTRLFNKRSQDLKCCMHSGVVTRRQGCTSSGLSLSDQVAVHSVAELRELVAVMASHRHGDGQSRLVPGTV